MVNNTSVFFFVLKPATHLYYFTSPNDHEPRGCIDLDNSTVKELQELPDGRYRFQLINTPLIPQSLNSDPDSTSHSSSHSIILEARSEEVGQEWVKCLQEERLSFLKGQINARERDVQHLNTKIDLLNEQINNFRLIEKDREGAIQDAADWKNKFNKLNQALRILTRQVKTRHENYNSTSQTEEEKNSLSSEDKKNASFASITDEERRLDAIDVHDSNFSSLHNACHMLLENIKLVSIEADSATQDLHDAKEDAKNVEKKLVKAEKLVCKLWEENCTMRDKIKKVKREKRVLVNEVKSLIQTIREKDTIIQQQQRTKEKHSEESRLIQELEEHLASTMRLHEQFRAANTRVIRNAVNPRNIPLSKNENQIPTSTASNIIDKNIEKCNAFHEDNIENPGTIDINTCSETLSNDDSSDRNDTKLDESFSPLRPTRLVLSRKSKSDNESLTSDVSSAHLSTTNGLVSEKSSNEEQFTKKEQPIDQADGSAVLSSNLDEEQSASTVNPTYQTQLSCSPITFHENDSNKSNMISHCKSANNSHSSHNDANKLDEESRSLSSASADRINPLDRLNGDEDQGPVEPDEPDEPDEPAPTRSVITDNGHATSKLVCPFDDVRGTNALDLTLSKRDDGEVYHLTFYGRKIGLQFQKVPIASNSGVLNDAMTTDVQGGFGLDNRHGRTAAELRMISSIADNDKLHPNRLRKKQDEFCKVATPIDAVLVCGFHGFDDTSNSQRPKLGSRLVAFDGVSVEIGRWTFDSVKRAIQARGRPLTLSFRNDYLTTQQRGILTKAVNDIEISRSRFPPKMQHSYQPQRSNINQDFYSSNHHESNYRIRNNNRSLTPNSSYSNRSGTSSFSSPAFVGGSFSDAGTSNLLSSTIGPLVAGLMTGLGQPESNGEAYHPPPPQYLQNGSNSLDNLPNHHDFKAGLL